MSTKGSTPALSTLSSGDIVGLRSCLKRIASVSPRLIKNSGISHGRRPTVGLGSIPAIQVSRPSEQFSTCDDPWAGYSNHVVAQELPSQSDVRGYDIDCGRPVRREIILAKSAHSKMSRECPNNRKSFSRSLQLFEHTRRLSQSTRDQPPLKHLRMSHFQPCGSKW